MGDHYISHCENVIERLGRRIADLERRNAALERQRDDLHVANNAYLKRARDAEDELRRVRVDKPVGYTENKRERVGEG